MRFIKNIKKIKKKNKVYLTIRKVTKKNYII